MDKETKKYVIYGILGVFFLIFFSWAFRYYTAEIRGIVDAEEQIESAESRIGNYEFFYDLCHSIQAHERQIEIQQNRYELAVSSGGDQNELSRIRSNIAGIQSVRESAIERYNSNARQSYTSGRFRASDLPYQLNPNNNTNCNWR